MFVMAKVVATRNAFLLIWRVDHSRKMEFFHPRNSWFFFFLENWLARIINNKDLTNGYVCIRFWSLPLWMYKRKSKNAFWILICFVFSTLLLDEFFFSILKRKRAHILYTQCLCVFLSVKLQKYLSCLLFIQP